MEDGNKYDFFININTSDYAYLFFLHHESIDLSVKMVAGTIPVLNPSSVPSFKSDKNPMIFDRCFKDEKSQPQ